jgi:glycosyltransferase involved in cell wall biosynthesis
MRILRVDSWDGQRGGAQDYIRAVVEELGRRGHENRVLNLTSTPEPNPREDETYLRVPNARIARTAFDLTFVPEFATAFRGLVREFDPEIVQVHHFDAGFTTLARLVREVKVPVVMTGHDAELVCPISTLVQPGNVICDGGIKVRCLFTGCRVGLGGPYNLYQRRSFDQNVAPRIRAYLCPSRSLTGYLDAQGYRPAIHLPSFAVIPPEIRTEEPPAPAPELPPTIGFLGRLDWYKGLPDLIIAFRRVREAFPSARLDIAGEGPDRPDLEAQVARVGLSSAVSFRGRVTGAAKEAWFRGIHVACVPSNMWENFPLVALEALVRSRPVVGTRVGGIPDIVDDGETGHLVPIGDPAALASALQDLLRDPTRARAWGGEGRRRVLARFTPERHLDRLVRIYEATLHGDNFRSGMEADEIPSGVGGTPR